MKKRKNGFAFTFFAFFLSILLFSYAYLNLSNDDYTKDNVFIESRIIHINDEILYLKNVYMKNSISYSLYNVLDALLIYEKANPSLNGNYTKLNSFVYESLINGTFDSIHQPLLENKTITYFLEKFQEDFEKNYKGNFDFEILAINIYEKQSYYVTLQFLAQFNISTQDNISRWDFKEHFEISVPIIGLNDPEFLLIGNHDILIRASEYELSFQNWNLENFNKTINNMYSTVYIENDYKYSIGNSYLDRLFNISRSSYKDVVGFWSFDYDEDEKGVYDTSRYNDLGKHFGSTVLLMNFDNGTIIGDQVRDLSAYGNNGTIFDAIWKDGVGDGVSGGCLEFDGVNDYVKNSNIDIGSEDNSSFSFSLWVKTDSTNAGVLIGKTGDAFVEGSADSNILLMMNQEGLVGWRLEYDGSNDEDYLYGKTKVNDGIWHNIVAIRKGWDFYIFIDGKLDIIYKKDDYYKNDGYREYNKGIKINSDLHIGTYRATSNFFKGMIDEVGVYSKALSDKEVADLYGQKRAKFIDYKDSLHGQGIEFDGIKDYVDLGNDLHVNIFHNNWTLETWVKPYELSGTQTIISKHHPFLLQLNGGKLRTGVFTSTGWVFIEGDGVLSERYNHIISMWNSNTRKLHLYVNGKLVSSSSVLNSITSNNNDKIYLGMDKYSSIEGRHYFNGIIDEVKIYNRTLSEKEIEQNYFNYDSFGKGCCNYLTLINPNKLGYNITTYKQNVSYSSRLFYDYFKRGFKPNIAFYNITNITSSDISKEYYNFLADSCMERAYNIMGLHDDENINVEFVTLDGIDFAKCENLIKLGIY